MGDPRREFSDGRKLLRKEFRETREELDPGVVLGIRKFGGEADVERNLQHVLGMFGFFEVEDRFRCANAIELEPCSVDIGKHVDRFEKEELSSAMMFLVDLVDRHERNASKGMLLAVKVVLFSLVT